MKNRKSIAGSFVAMMALVASAGTSPAMTNDAVAAMTHSQIIRDLRVASRLADRNSRSWSQEPLTQADFDAQELISSGWSSVCKKASRFSSAEINEALAGPDTDY
jgi:hypothetical protein